MGRGVEMESARVYLRQTMRKVAKARVGILRDLRWEGSVVQKGRRDWLDNRLPR